MAENIRQVRGAWPAVFIVDGPIMSAWPMPDGAAGVFIICGRPVEGLESVDLRRLAAWSDRAGRKGGAE